METQISYDILKIDMGTSTMCNIPLVTLNVFVLTDTVQLVDEKD